MKCEWCRQNLYSIEMNYRDGNKTTKKVIGKICAICDKPRDPTTFWSQLSQDKKLAKKQKENEIGTKASPRMLAKTICGKCRSSKVKFRKLKVPVGNTQSYQVTCTNCKHKWRQAWKNYKDLEQLGWASKRIVQ